MTKKAALIILDGWGIGKEDKVNALALAHTPYTDSLTKNMPHAELVTFGEEVGLPDGQMGNSEVGHLNIGAGRVVYQELARINKAIKENTLVQNSEIQKAIANAKAGNKKVHLMGLVSDGGVHSHINLGRYFAMDRDNRWERVKKAYDLLVNAVGNKTENIIADVKCSYDEGVTDEFMEPLQLVNQGKPVGNITADDTVIFYNYRTDRPREITKMLTQVDMPEQETKRLPLYFVTMTMYDASFEGLHVIFTKDNLKNTIGEVVSDAGLTQVRIAETEKYPHVTFFFSGGQEEPFSGESRIMVNSPDVPTYDLQPEMSCPEITAKLIAHVKAELPDFICLNYANTDMVGHTGIMSAAIKAAETVDSYLAQLMEVLQDHDYETIIIADHGNSDIMANADGSPHTAHTTNMVPVWYVGSHKNVTLNNGKLGDIAPTLLNLMGVDSPEEMEGKLLLTLPS